MFYRTILLFIFISSLLYVERKNIFFFIFFRINISFSYLLTQSLFLKRKVNQDFEFFLIDPNIRVYCYILVFLIFIFLFSCIFFFFFSRTRWIGFFLKEEYIRIFFFFFLLIYRFIWSYFFVDNDISNTFRFNINFRDHYNKNSQYLSDRSTFSIKHKGIPIWEFSVYFFNLYGLLFDVYFVRIAYILVFWYYCFFFFSKKIEIWLQSMLRICVIIISTYFFSGESFIYDIVLILILSFFIESFIFFRLFIWNLFKWHKNLMFNYNLTNKTEFYCSVFPIYNFLKEYI